MTTQPSPPAAARARSTTSAAGASPSRSVHRPDSCAGVEDPHVADEGRGAAVAHRRHLAGLALAAVEGPAEQVGGLAAHRLHRAPEVGRGGLVGDVAELAGQPAVLDPEEALAGELEVVALHVDRPALVAHDEDAPVHPGDQLLGGRAVTGSRLQRDVGHALDGDVQGRVGEGAAVGPAEPARRRRWPGRAGSRPGRRRGRGRRTGASTPSSSMATVASPWGTVRSPVTCMTADP